LIVVLVQNDARGVVEDVITVGTVRLASSTVVGTIDVGDVVAIF